MTLEAKVENLVGIMNGINETVPKEAKSILAEIGRLDELANKQSKKVQSLKIDFIEKFESMSVEQRTKTCDVMEAEMREILELSDKKVKLSRELHEKIKNAQSSFEIAAKKFEKTRPKVETPRGRRRQTEESNDEEGFKSPSSLGRRGKKTENKEDNDGEDEFYCWCRLEKNDEMIFCECPSCPHQWYHFTCIGMVAAPQGHFYCSLSCRDAMMKKGKGGSKKSKRKS